MLTVSAPVPLFRFVVVAEQVALDQEGVAAGAEVMASVASPP